MLDLYNIKYNRNILKEHIYSLNLMDIIKTQTLDISFIVKYILSDLYQLTEEDKTIDVNMVLRFQPHIKKEDLNIALENYNSDDESIEDFQSFSENN